MALPKSPDEPLAVGPLEVLPAEHLALVDGTTLTLSLIELRVKLEAALPGWSFIHTHFGFGYRALTPVAAGPARLEVILALTRPSCRAIGR
jgi:hypothetical protein